MCVCVWGFVWPAVTRYCGVLLKMKRFHAMRDLLRRVVGSGVYADKNFKDDPFKAKVEGEEVWKQMEMVMKTMGPLLLLCRLADGQKGVISKLHGTQLYVKDKIERVANKYGAGTIAEAINSKFLARWPEMQSKIAQATYPAPPPDPQAQRGGNRAKNVCLN